MATSDPVSQVLVKLVLDDRFRKRFNDAKNNAARKAMLKKAFPQLAGIKGTVVDALASRASAPVADHLFGSQQVSSAGQTDLAKALRVALKAIEK
jgi:hypothetical protein